LFGRGHQSKLSNEQIANRSRHRNRYAAPPRATLDTGGDELLLMSEAFGDEGVRVPPPTGA
jgi:hypothetical protein